MTLKEYFPGIPAVRYEGSYSTNPFAFKFYNAERVTAGKPLREHLRFALSFEKALCTQGADLHGSPTADRLFGASPANPMQYARERLYALMELLHKLGVRYFTLRDRDLAPEGDSLRESNARLDEMTECLLYLQQVYSVQPLQVSADLITHPRYMNGSATSNSAEVFAFAAAQVKKALELAYRLDSLGFCVTGGREGREHLLCVNETLEQDNLARLLRLVAAHAAAIGYKGELSIRPSPPGAVRGAYWPDSAQCLAFLRRYDLDSAFRITLGEGATLAEFRTLLQGNALGSLASPCFHASEQAQGSASATAATLAMRELLHSGGFRSGGLLLESLPQRSSNTLEDLCITLLLAMDAYALGLTLAQRTLLDGRMEQFSRDRYASFTYGIGKAILEGTADMDALETHALQRGEVSAASARQEYLEAVLHSLLFRGN
ncbi:MAG: xylose isomerase [Oscillospiraceae bacterium]|nr:xylose isomerase [Oscillospiraceae bacterium]